MCICHISIKHYLLTYLLTAIRARWFGKKLRAQEEPKSLPPDAFPRLQICQNAFAAGALPRTPLGELTVLPQTPSWIKGGLLLRGGEGKRKGRGGKARGGEGKGEEGKGGEERGRGCCAPLSQIPGSAHDISHKSIWMLGNISFLIE